MSIKFWTADKADRPNVLYRIIVARFPQVVSGAATNFNSVYPFETATLGASGKKDEKNRDCDTEGLGEGDVKAKYEMERTNVERGRIGSRGDNWGMRMGMGGWGRTKRRVKG